MPGKRLKGEERRHQILTEASRAFALFGFEAVRVKDIARACNTDAALIYHHFPSKESLYKEATELFYTELKSRWTADTDGAASGIAGLRAFFVNRFREIYEHPELAHGIFNITLASQISAELGAVTSGHCRSILDRVETLVRSLQKDKSIRTGLDPSAVATWFLSYYFFIFFIVRDSAQERYPFENAVSILDEFIGSIKPSIRRSSVSKSGATGSRQKRK